MPPWASSGAGEVLLDAIQAKPWWTLFSTWCRAHPLDDALVRRGEVVDVVAVLLAGRVVHHL